MFIYFVYLIWDLKLWGEGLCFDFSLFLTGRNFWCNWVEFSFFDGICWNLNCIFIIFHWDLKIWGGGLCFVFFFLFFLPGWNFDVSGRNFHFFLWNIFGTWKGIFYKKKKFCRIGISNFEERAYVLIFPLSYVVGIFMALSGSFVFWWNLLEPDWPNKPAWLFLIVFHPFRLKLYCKAKVAM